MRSDLHVLRSSTQVRAAVLDVAERGAPGRGGRGREGAFLQRERAQRQHQLRHPGACVCACVCVRVRACVCVRGYTCAVCVVAKVGLRCMGVCIGYGCVCVCVRVCSWVYVLSVCMRAT